jgi:hypothetical protein
MEGLLNLETLYATRRFGIPDYQRSYSWERRQWADLIEDLDVLRPGKQHFTGMVVLHQNADDIVVDQGGAEHKHAQVVDGQQRLTTLVLLLDAIRRGARAIGSDALADGIENRFLWLVDQQGQRRPKLSFADGSDPYFRARVIDELPGPQGPGTPAERRIRDATEFFRGFVDTGAAENGDGATWLLDLHNKVSHRLMFNPFFVTDLSEVGVIFEVMNDRGRPLSDMDLVKNYVLYLGQQSQLDEDMLHDEVMDSWKRIFSGLMQAELGSGGDEDQLLRAHWRMAYDHAPRNWQGSQSIKGRFNLRDYVDRDAELLGDLREYVRTLGDASVPYCDVFAPHRTEAFAPFGPDDRIKVTGMSHCLLRVGVVAVFLPVLMAARLRHPEDGAGYLELLRSCERYAFRVNRLQGSRADAGRSRLLQIAWSLFHGDLTMKDASGNIDETSLHYCSHKDFVDAFFLDVHENDWYSWGGLRYLLYEYERYRTGNEDLAVTWAELKAADRPKTIEHILPQTPTAAWEEAFSSEERARLTHDLGNLCLTQDNSSYSNKPFAEKKGYPGANYRCYSNGALQTERDVAAYDNWTPTELINRRERIVKWALERWGLPASHAPAPDVEELAADDEIVEEPT